MDNPIADVEIKIKLQNMSYENAVRLHNMMREELISIQRQRSIKKYDIETCHGINIVRSSTG